MRSKRERHHHDDDSAAREEATKAEYLKMCHVWNEHCGTDYSSFIGSNLSTSANCSIRRQSRGAAIEKQLCQCLTAITRFYSKT
jgi:hypothetical protein